MMLLTKLKMVAVAVLAAIALTGGFGIGLVPAAAGDEPVPGSAVKPAIVTASPAGIAQTKTDGELQKIAINERNFDVDVDDATFLRRLTLDLRGDLPTPVEMWFFVADRDADKRTKVVAWMVDDKVIVAQLAKKLSVPADRIRVIRVATSQEGKTVTLLAIASDGDQKDQQPMFNLYRRQRVVDNSSKTAEVAYFLNDSMVGDNVNLWDARNGKQVQSSGKVRWRVWDAATGKQLEPKKTGNAGESHSVQPGIKQGFFSILDADKVEENRTFKDVTVEAGLAQIVTVATNDSSWAYLDMDNDANRDLFIVNQVLAAVDIGNDKNSDVEFLKKVLHDVRGTPPTSLEEKYFSEDKDPKKREKLLDTLLKDPAVAKKLGDDWKKKMIESHSRLAQTPTDWRYEVVELNGNSIVRVPASPQAPKAPADPTKRVIEWQIVPAPPKTPQPPAVPAKPAIEVQVVPAPPKAPQAPADSAKGVFEYRVVPVNPTVPQPPADPTKPVVVPVAPKTPQAPAQQPRRVVIEQDVVKVPLDPNVTQKPVAARLANRLEKLVGELLAAKKTDAEMLEAVTLATVGRLPTDVEKRLTLGLVAKTADRNAVWIEVAKAMAATDEGPKPGVIEVVPVLPAKK